MFREVAGDHASYFTGLDADTLTGAIRDWLSQVRQDRHRRSDEMPWLTWEESTRQLLDVILKRIPGLPAEAHFFVFEGQAVALHVVLVHPEIHWKIGRASCRERV